jgi:UDP-N-acetylmuramate--alanine ligase
MLESGTRFHLLGIGGIGVSAVARVLLERGFAVSGSDIRESQLTEGLRKQGARIEIGHKAANVQNVDVVVVSTAIPEDNPELVAAREQGITVAHRADVLNALIQDRLTVGVTGTHGKGTVSSMITWILDQAGREPGFVIGGLLNNYGTNARDGRDLFVVEVDESDGSHHNVTPNHVVCNFLELDHLNYYAGIDDIIEAMTEFIANNPKLEQAYVNADCAGNRRMLEKLGVPVVTYGIESADADFRAELVGNGQLPLRFRLIRHGELLGEVELNLPGRYNALNASGAIAVAMALGVDFDTAAKALAKFRGLENRFTIDKAAGVWLVKDYISHPTGMRKVLESARDLVDGRIISVFKPYRYTLMKYLKDEYATAFEGSDEVIITTMYAANEKPIPGVDTESFVQNLRDAGYRVTYIPDQDEIRPWVLNNAAAGDKVIFFGGDDFFRLCDGIRDELAAR